MSVASYHVLLCDGRNCQIPGRRFNPWPNHHETRGDIRRQAGAKGWVTNAGGGRFDYCPACAAKRDDRYPRYTGRATHEHANEITRAQLPGEVNNALLRRVADNLSVRRLGARSLVPPFVRAIPDAAVDSERELAALSAISMLDARKWLEDVKISDETGEGVSLPERVLEQLIPVVRLCSREDPTDDELKEAEELALVGAAAFVAIAEGCRQAREDRRPR